MKPTKEQIAKEIKDNCLVNFGKTLSNLIKELKSTSDFKSFGSAFITPKTKCGHKIMITNNSNFAGGVKKGSGAGVYAILQGVGVTNEIKIAEV